MKLWHHIKHLFEEDDGSLPDIYVEEAESIFKCNTQPGPIQKKPRRHLTRLSSKKLRRRKGSPMLDSHATSLLLYGKRLQICR